MRSLIDMAADRAPFIDQSQSLNLFIEPERSASSPLMYMYAWKRGLEDHLLPAVPAGDRDRQDDRLARLRDLCQPGVLAGKSRVVRVLPVTEQRSDIGLKSRNNLRLRGGGF